MLVLTRRLKESIRVGDDIVITVVEMEGNQVRLGISAPRDVPVHREELYQEIVKEILAENEIAGTYPARLGSLPLPKREG